MGKHNLPSLHAIDDGRLPSTTSSSPAVPEVIHDSSAAPAISTRHHVLKPSTAFPVYAKRNTSVRFCRGRKIITPNVTKSKITKEYDSQECGVVSNDPKPQVEVPSLNLHLLYRNVHAIESGRVEIDEELIRLNINQRQDQQEQHQIEINAQQQLDVKFLSQAKTTGSLRHRAESARENFQYPKHLLQPSTTFRRLERQAPPETLSARILEEVKYVPARDNSAVARQRCLAQHYKTITWMRAEHPNWDTASNDARWETAKMWNLHEHKPTRPNPYLWSKEHRARVMTCRDQVARVEQYAKHVQQHQQECEDARLARKRVQRQAYDLKMLARNSR